MSIIAKLGLSSKDFSQALGKVEKEGKSFSTNFASAIKKSFAVAGTAIATFATKGAIDFTNFEKKITEVFTLIPDAGKDAFGKLEDGVRSLSVEMGVDLTDAVNGLYQAISAGVPHGSAIDFLKTASKASIAGVASLETSVGALTTIINGYGLEMEEAEKVSDVLFSVVKNGVTNFTELGTNVGKVTPIASALGVEIDELGSLFVVLTKQMGAGKTAEAGTALRAMLAELAKEGMKANKNFAELGQGTFPEFIARGGKVTEALQLMKDSAQSNGKSLMDMFRGVEAGNGALMVMTQEGESASQALDALQKDVGSVEVAFNALSSTSSKDFDKMMATLKDLSIEFGSAFSPLIKELLPDTTSGLKSAKESIKAFGDSIASIIRFVKDFALEIGVLVAGIAGYKAGLILAEVATLAFSGTLTGTSRAMKGFKIAMGALMVGNFTKALGGLNVALRAVGATLVANPIGLFIAGLTAVIAPIVLFKKELADQTEKAKESARAIREDLVNAIDGLEQKVKSGADELKSLDDKIAEMQKKRDIQIFGEPPIEKAKDFFEIVRDTFEKDRERNKEIEKQLELAEKQLEEAKKNRDLQKEINQDVNGYTDEKREALVETGLLAEEILKVQEAEKKVKELTLEHLENRVKIKDNVDLLITERLKEKQVAEDINEAIEKTNINFELQKTEAGKIVLEQEKIAELEKQKRELIDKAKQARVLEAGEATKLKGIENGILTARKNIRDIIRDQMIKAHQDEVDEIDLKNQEVDKLLRLEQDRLGVIQDAKDAKAKEVQVLRDALAEARKDLDAFKKFWRVDFNGALKINVKELREEFKELKKAGELPDNVKTLKDFEDLIRHQSSVAKSTRDDIIEQGRIAKAEHDELIAQEKTALANKKAIEGQINAQTIAKIAKEKELEDIKSKTSDELVSATGEMATAIDKMKDFKVIPPQIPGTLVDAVNSQTNDLSSINQGVKDFLDKDMKLDTNDLTKEDTQQKILNTLGGFFVNL